MPAEASAPGRFAFELRARGAPDRTTARTMGALLDSFREQGRAMHLEAESEADRKAWMEALSAAAAAAD